ncbi:pollen-specific leucine-rich repeat extensin-like protein 1 isoform X1 [Diachasma alloeum]|uniref:pollen-specific leucine-rich repeat extensin-like protein 1 isoform X1 n=1 Tax=Diachasma alloeum TaxID=454923 RepID=UPI00073843D7|nr:pollen-specific leucine-rich repeat extensin-like protein 1 isoform X1 [Diachasma alloeum]XP_015126581.1 pollen-specific leucine-rich repeat extensin-like protein 1 isoform X1 [Diachasma alloeum]XP_015126582.1 pollen-specific leucine-rich repeat extensin-like protein 1 isoform X1 [Diachasma alloeum]XP_015126583.1 pollen-specific leucine-rich repeat extensin-like protein 1 isoform X1 [Diachasma alloeum]XP_015126585.1 pollen-specific leucine-rich repeat extensin-like protein 1 isoform X1 [Diac
MLAGHVPKLVNKQFNSPINLYSPQAVQETLERQTKILANGAIGIDFNQLAKPANLQNSAVLKMLEEEEARKRSGGQPGLKRVTWPPPAGDDDIDFIEQSPVQAKTRGVGEYASYETSPSSGPSPQPHTSLPCASPQLSTPLSPGGTLRTPQGYQHQIAPKPWAPVTPPATSPLPAHEISWGSHRSHQPVFKKSDSIEGAAPRHQSSQPFSQPPPSVITLRPEPPISQQPAPVYQAQPAATMAPVSGNMRGDMKWPPASVKAQTEAENRARVELAKGPIFRPRRVNKDYSGFFAQHALNSTYPGYRAPPGTQYFTPSYQH